MVEQIKPSPRLAIVPTDSVPDQKMSNRRELPPPPVSRKNEIAAAREEVPREEVEKATDKLNRLMGIVDKRLEFTIHEKSKTVMVKVIDQETGNVIDEIPPKRLLDFLSSFREMVGLLVDKQV